MTATRSETLLWDVAANRPSALVVAPSHNARPALDLLRRGAAADDRRGRDQALECCHRRAGLGTNRVLRREHSSAIQPGWETLCGLRSRFCSRPFRQRDGQAATLTFASRLGRCRGLPRRWPDRGDMFVVLKTSGYAQVGRRDWHPIRAARRRGRAASRGPESDGTLVWRPNAAVAYERSTALAASASIPFRTIVAFPSW